MSLLSVKNLQIKIFGQTIVDGVSFDIKPGEIVSLVGPNGAGKTMLVKAILGLQNFSGEATLEGQPVIENLHKIGYVPQYFIFDRTFPLTVFEFLNLAYRLAKNNFKEQVCSELGVEKMMDKRLGKLSGGELQRVLIAQALMNDPKLLILDEPTANVDAGGAQNFYELVKHLRDDLMHDGDYQRALERLP